MKNWKVLNLCFDRIERYKIRNILNSRLFWIVLLLKLVSMALFSSEFLSDYFAPFVKFFVQSGFQNPYDNAVNLSFSDSFPYPSLMLYLLSLMMLPFSFFMEAGVVTNLDIFLLRIPVLFFDFLILIVLARWIKGSSKNLLKYYWSSPVLFYISYLHGQIDAVPIGLLFASLYFLFKEKFKLSLVILALGIATKTHLILVLPFYCFYLVSKKESIFKIIKLLILATLAFVAVNLNYIFNNNFLKMVFFNKQQMKVLDLFLPIGSEYKIYIVVLLFVFLVVKGASIKVYNRNVLISLIGFCFSLVTLFVVPGRGWYFWIIPFLTYF